MKTNVVCLRTCRMLRALLMWVVMIVQSHAADFTYTNDGGTLTVTGYIGTGGKVDIPSVIDGLTVTSIGDGAFSGLTNLTAVSIPDSVTNLGAEAFFNCANLASVRFGKGLRTLASGGGSYGTFMNCYSLTRVSIPDTVTNIEDGSMDLGGSIGAFWNCTGLTNVIIGKGLGYLGVGTFSWCTNLVGVYFEGDAPTPGHDLFGHDIFYQTPAVAYYLPGTAGWGSNYADIAAVLWNPQAQTGDGNFGRGQNGFGFNITGTAGIPFVVEASTNLEAGPWASLQTCTLTNGSIYFSDPQWKDYLDRFYRIRSP